MAGHLHIDARIDCADGCILWVRGKAVGRQVEDGLPVAHDEAIKLPPVAQDVLKKKFVSCSRHSVQVHIGSHEGTCAGPNRCVEGRKIYIPELLVRDIGGVVISSSIRGTIARKVLDTGENAMRAPYCITLKAAYPCFRHARPEKRIFTRAFHH